MPRTSPACRANETSLSRRPQRRPRTSSAGAARSAASAAMLALPAAGAGTPGTVSLSREQFRYALANFEGADALYDRYVIPAPGSWSWEAPAGRVLEVTGSEDNLTPRTSGAVVMPGRTHLTILQPGWEDVADQVLAWAQE